MQFVGDNTNKGVKELGLKAEEQKILKGYESKADTMFVARLSPLTP
jgi:16S rRNA (cytosine967-C5)-methyltransferase